MTELERYKNALNGLKNYDIRIDKEIRYPSIMAIEKQIPKKPVHKGNFFIVPYCPTCDSCVGVGQMYCDKCGQRLVVEE